MFLNKETFVNFLFTLFDESQKELVLIVPYVKMTIAVHDALKECSDRGVEICIVCRKDKVNPTQMQKLADIDRMTVLTHPNLHSKIYLNEYNILLGSMNLYDYSEKYNREAGYMFSRSDSGNSLDADECIREINEIISGSSIHKASNEVLKNGLDFKILKNRLEIAHDNAKILSRNFLAKKFNIDLSNFKLDPVCENFYDNITVVVNNRFEIYPRYSEVVLDKIFNLFNPIPPERINGLRLYNEKHNKRFTLYAKDGEYISDLIYQDKQYVREIESFLMDFCEWLDSIYKKH
tara:strand:- start:23352 stop:24227 length:876 start_codon:yes stop_codon:yes gene_type:complete